MHHLTSETLQYYLGGSLPSVDVYETERHLADCRACRRELSILVRVTSSDLSPEEAAIVDSVEASMGKGHQLPVQAPAAHRWSSWWSMLGWRFAAVAGGVLGAIGLIWFAFAGLNPGPAAQLALADRPFEARLADHSYAPFERTRAGRNEAARSEPDSQLSVGSAGNETLGRFYLAHGDSTNAIKYLELAAKNAPDSPSVRNDLGVAYLESGNEFGLTKAASEFRQALTLNERYEPALFNLAIAYERLGYLPEAQQHLKLYLQIDSQSLWAQEVKAKLQLWQH